jgi:hypothetical protein
MFNSSERVGQTPQQPGAGSWVASGLLTYYAPAVGVLLLEKYMRHEADANPQPA